MKKTIAAILLLIVIGSGLFIAFRKPSVKAKKTVTAVPRPKPSYEQRLKAYALRAEKYASKHHFNRRVCFLADMSLHSGKNRLFIYDLVNKKILQSGLVAHGSCNRAFLIELDFSN